MASVGDEGRNQGGSLSHGETNAGQESETSDRTPPNSSNTKTSGVQEIAAAASKDVPTIHFVRVSSGDMDHHCQLLFSPPAYCNSYYPPLPPQPGSMATNQIVARLMAQMNYEEGTGLGKYGHGIIDPINPTKNDSDYDTGPPVEPKLERGTGEAEPEAVVDVEEVRAMDTLQRESEAYAAARAWERRHEKV
uniref:G-patch domain-containing protein n=1 Tax=Oryza rufipogon TaxID=4529 RepID=A0A0E0PBI4_ORYRU